MDESTGWWWLWLIPRVFGPQLPFYMVLLVGIVLALITRKRHPVASLWASLGCGLWLLSSIGISVFYLLLPQLLYREERLSTDEIANVYFVSGLVSSLLHAIAMGMLVMAIFSNRRRPDIERAFPERHVLPDDAIFSNQWPARFDQH